MKRLLAIIGLLISLHAGAACNPPFVSQTILSAAALNNAIMNPCIVSGSLDSVTITNSIITGATGSFTTLTSPLVSITGGLIDGTKIGSGTPSTGAFSTLSASGAVSGIGFSTYLASPPAIGGTAPAAIAGTTITANTSAAVGSGVTGGVFQAYTGGGHFSLYSGAVTPGAGNYGLTINDTQSFINGSGAGGSYMEYNGTPVVSVTGASSTSVAGTLSATTFSGAGTSLTGTAASLTAGNATTAATATNVAGGTQGGVLYQSAVGTTASTAAGTSGYVLTSNGTAAPTFQSAGSPYNPASVAITGGTATLSTININGVLGTPGGIGYQSTTHGLFIWGKTGTTDDFEILNNSGATVASVPTGTTNFVVTGQFTGPGTGLTGTAASLSIGGNATTATTATNATNLTGSGTISATTTGGAGLTVTSKTTNTTPVLVAGADTYTVSHSLGVVPSIVKLEYYNITPEQGYSIGDVVQVVSQWNGATQGSLMIWKNTGQVGIICIPGYTPMLNSKSGGGSFTPTAADWGYRFVLER